MTACVHCHYDPDAQVVSVWTLWLPLPARSQNRLVSQGSARWAYRSYAKDVATALEVEKRRLHVPSALRHRRVTLTRVWGKKERAYDRINLAGGLKPVLDGLIKTGLLVDDSERWVEDHYEQRGPAVEPGIEVLLEELAP